MAEQAKLELFDNPRPERDYVITIRCPEFTSVCPRTGQPDFGEIIIEYCPDKSCIELKSLKFYMQTYRNKGIFYEALTNDILDDLRSACKPRWMKVTSRFRPRGGITTEVVAEYKTEDRSLPRAKPRGQRTEDSLSGVASAKTEGQKLAPRVSEGI